VGRTEFRFIQHKPFCVYYLPFVFVSPLTAICGPGSSVGIATDYGLDGPGSNPVGDEIFCPSRPVPWAHPSSCKMGTASFPEVKRLGSGAGHSPPSSAAVMEE